MKGKSMETSLVCYILQPQNTFEKGNYSGGKVKITNVSLLYCHCYFALSAESFFFLYRNFQLGTRKCPLLGVR